MFDYNKERYELAAGVAKVVKEEYDKVSAKKKADYDDGYMMGLDFAYSMYICKLSECHEIEMKTLEDIGVAVDIKE